LLLQIGNLILAGAAAWVFYRAPDLWGGQAQLYFGLAGVALGSFTAGVCSLSLMFGKGEGAAALHGLLGLGLASAQIFWLFRFGSDSGILEFICHKFHI
jgi:hypothetical protein